MPASTSTDGVRTESATGALGCCCVLPRASLLGRDRTAVIRTFNFLHSHAVFITWSSAAVNITSSVCMSEKHVLAVKPYFGTLWVEVSIEDVYA
ncbi:hypothetical protein NM688_g1319 [Phlebia brevispora]|uniref:Uncharacterized protein n=1 Tax=Phlebia brevispora TaxID=194682 RepID=A0ACC1TC66_9APHY|nr:hypothetical protein NM688_g1319 [Phlebia brevispora]